MVQSTGYRYIFGPVASRRFGRSLGVDLLGQRICSFNCIFCEAGPTQTCTMKRDVYVPIEVVLGELRAWYGSGGEADVVTLAGRGEPTLHTGFGTVIDAIHGMCDIPVVLLSNGSLMSLPDVRRDAARADVVKVSLSGWDDASIQHLNQPVAGLRFTDYLAGLKAFRQVFKGELRIEVMFVSGLNDSEEEARKIAACAGEVGADKIELNTVVRPPADCSAGPVPVEILQQYAAFFGPGAVVIGGAYVPPHMNAKKTGHTVSGGSDLASRLRSLLSHRGCTLDEITVGLGVPTAEIEALLLHWVESGIVQQTKDVPAYYQLITGSLSSR